MKCLWCHEPLFSDDSSLYIHTDKSSFMHAGEEYPALTAQPGHYQLPDKVPTRHAPRVLNVDGMGVLQGMTKAPAIQKLSDLTNLFTGRNESMMNGYSEGRVIFDNYLDQSLKDKTRQKRATMSTEFAVHPEMKLSMSTKELLSSSKTKHHLTCMFAEGLLEHFSVNRKNIKLVVTYNNIIKESQF